MQRIYIWAAAAFLLLLVGCLWLIDQAPSLAPPSDVPGAASGRPPSKISDHGASGSKIRLSPASLEDHLEGEAEFRAAKLLADFELTGNMALLEQAQKMFPNDGQVILSSALMAKSPTSEWLAKMELLHPDNSVPNLIRAGLYAKAADQQDFAKELAIALTKDAPDTYAQERFGRILGYVTSTAGSALPGTLIPQEDMVFESQLSAISADLIQNSKLDGNDLTPATTAIALAAKLRQGEDRSITIGFWADILEEAVLGNLPSDDEYGDTGKTAGERRQELQAEIIENEKGVEQLRALIFSNPPDPVLRLQFFMHMQADGDRAAVEWLFSRGK